MRHYEIVIIVHINQSAHIQDILKKYSDLITKGNGVVHRMEDWGRRKLAYPINKLYKGHYALFNIECSQEILDKLNYNFRFNDNIIRSLITSCKEKITKPSIIMLKKEQDTKKTNYETSKK